MRCVRPLLILALLGSTPGFFDQTARAEKERPLVQSPYDPAAKKVELFSALTEGTLSAQLTPRGAEGGSLFLTNHSDAPVTVKMPAGFVGVPVLPQFGPLGPFGQGSQTGTTFGNQGLNNGATSGMASANGTQAFGGGTSSQMSGTNSGNSSSGLNSMFGNTNGFFSIPAGKTLRLPYTSVCLNHGLKEPTARSTVKLVPVDEYTSDPVLQELIQQVASGKQSQKTMQAAVWHIANGLTWRQLAEKGHGPVRVPGDHYFSPTQMTAARDLVKQIRSTLPAEEQVAGTSHAGRVLSTAHSR